MAGKNLSAFLTVDLAMNTSKFQRSIKGVSGSTKTILTALNKVTVTAKNTASALLSVGKAVIGIGTGAALAGIYALSRGAAENVKSFEDLRAKLSGVTGDLKTAEAVFWELNSLEDQTTLSTQELSEALLYLNKFGISATSADMKNLSAVSMGLNRDLNSVISAIGKAAQGRYNQLKELGFGVEDLGNKLNITFKGVSTQIGKDSESIKKYLSNLGETQFSEVLNAKLQTTSAALGRFKNAWGTLQTEIFRSDGIIGGIFRKIYDTGADAVNGLTQVFKLESVQRALKSSVDSVYKIFQMLYEKITGKTFDFKKSWSEIWLDLFNAVDEFLAKFKLFSTALIGAFKIIAAGVKDFLITPIISVINVLKKELAEVAEFSLSDKIAKGFELSPAGRMISQIKNWKGGFFQADIEAYTKLVDNVVSEYEKNGSAFAEALKDNEAAMNEASKEYAQTLKDIQEREEELKNKLKENGSGESFIDSIFGIGSGTGTGSGASGARGKIKALTDNLLSEWKRFYNSLITENRNSLSERQRLEIEHVEQLRELSKYAAVASAEEVSSAREMIDKAYFEKRKELEENAQREYFSIMENETELLKLETEKRIELIRSMYEDNYLSAAEFMEAQSKLIDDYYKKAGRKNNKDTILSDESVKRVNDLKDATLNLSDAFGDMASAAGKGSSTYKALFAIQKGFAVASATMNAILAWSQALADPTDPSWISKLAKYANAIALTTNILSQLKSVQMYDQGGQIKAGELGIVGEIGPELIQGPANVTGRKETAELLRNKGEIIVNLYEDNEKAGSVEEAGTDEETIINIFVSNIRRGGEAASALEGTYNLQRFGV